MIAVAVLVPSSVSVRPSSSLAMTRAPCTRQRNGSVLTSHDIFFIYLGLTSVARLKLDWEHCWPCRAARTSGVLLSQ